MERRVASQERQYLSPELFLPALLPGGGMLSFLESIDMKTSGVSGKVVVANVARRGTPNRKPNRLSFVGLDCRPTLLGLFVAPPPARDRNPTCC
jgi:hypothetical protein